MSTSRGALKYYIFTIITFGIYALVFWSCLCRDVNTGYEGGKKQKGLFIAILLSLITFGIYLIVWVIILVSRIYNKAAQNNVGSSKSLVFFILSFTVLSWTVICPILAMSGVCKTTNNICRYYNENHK